MKKVLPVFFVAAGSLMGVQAVAADFPTGTMECRYHDWNDATHEKSITVTISEADLGVALPVVSVVAPEAKYSFRGIASVIQSRSDELTLTVPAGFTGHEDLQFSSVNGKFKFIRLEGAFNANCD